MGNIYNKVCKIEMFLAVLFLAVSVLALTLSAALRTAQMPIAWGLDIALMLFSWSTFLGADIAFRKKALINVDMLVKALPVKIQRVLDGLVNLLMVAAIIFMLIYGIKLVIISRARVMPSISWLSYSWVTASVPVSMALMLISALKQIYETFFQRKNETTKTDNEGLPC
jgi:TRAP-type C4-dicarboxylate transport system permease small subunit